MGAAATKATSAWAHGLRTAFYGLRGNHIEGALFTAPAARHSGAGLSTPGELVASARHSRRRGGCESSMRGKCSCRSPVEAHGSRDAQRGASRAAAEPAGANWSSTGARASHPSRREPAREAGCVRARDSRRGRKPVSGHGEFYRTLERRAARARRRARVGWRERSLRVQPSIDEDAEPPRGLSARGSSRASFDRWTSSRASGRSGSATARRAERADTFTNARHSLVDGWARWARARDVTARQQRIVGGSGSRRCTSSAGR